MIAPNHRHARFRRLFPNVDKWLHQASHVYLKVSRFVSPPKLLCFRRKDLTYCQIISCTDHSGAFSLHLYYWLLVQDRISWIDYLNIPAQQKEFPVLFFLLVRI